MRFEDKLIRTMTFTAVLAMVAAGRVAADEDVGASTRELPSREASIPATLLANEDWDALRKWFHQPQFNVTDGLTAYTGEPVRRAEVPSPRITAR